MLGAWREGSSRRGGRPLTERSDSSGRWSVGALWRVNGVRGKEMTEPPRPESGHDLAERAGYPGVGWLKRNPTLPA